MYMIFNLKTLIIFNLFIFCTLSSLLEENSLSEGNLTNIGDRYKRKPQDFFFPGQQIPNYNLNYNRRRQNPGRIRAARQRQRNLNNNNFVNPNVPNIYNDEFAAAQNNYQAAAFNNNNGLGFPNQQLGGQNFNRFPNRRRRPFRAQNNFLLGYSGFRPNGWGTGIYGEKQKRISQIKYEEYMRRIYGDENYDENNDILSPDDLNGRVIAEPGEFPHIAVIGIRTARGPGNVHWKCGGSLIDINFVLTAAHCCSFGGEAPNWVKVGDVNLEVREDTVATQRFRIADIYRHPLYKDNLNYYDIALVRLIRPAVFTKHVRPARLWASDELPFNKVFALGYGSTKFGKTPTNVLTFFNLSIINNSECNKKLPPTGETPSGILVNQICAVDLEQHRDTCQGDSGGPLELILPGRRRVRYYIIGITSFGVACTGQQPSVYTKVFSYLDWIESIVWPINNLQQQQQQQFTNNYYNG